MTVSLAVKGMLHATPEIHDLYPGQPLMQMRRSELLKLATANGIATEVPLENGRVVDGKPELRTLTKDELVPRLQIAVNDGRIRFGRARPGAGLPDAAEAQAAFRRDLEAATAFQLRAMLPKEHGLARRADARKAELVDAIMAIAAAV
jgi:hypothetical protein